MPGSMGKMEARPGKNYVICHTSFDIKNPVHLEHEGGLINLVPDVIGQDASRRTVLYIFPSDYYYLGRFPRVRFVLLHS